MPFFVIKKICGLSEVLYLLWNLSASTVLMGVSISLCTVAVFPEHLSVSCPKVEGFQENVIVLQSSGTRNQRSKVARCFMETCFRVKQIGKLNSFSFSAAIP